MLEEFLSYLKASFSGSRPLLLVSGGLDSTVLSYCFKQAGLKFAIFYGDSAIRPFRFKSTVEQLAHQLKVPLKICKTDELLLKEFLINPEKRCYHCKRILLTTAKKVLESEGYTTLVDGTNKDDLKDYRPGMHALKEFNVMSPLLTYGLGKSEIIYLRDELGIDIAAEATTCLATRFIDRNKAVDPALFKYLEETEFFLSSLGFKNVRLRVLKGKLLVQVNSDQVGSLSEVKKLIKYPLGYTLEVDPYGYRSAGLMLTGKEL